MQVRPQPQQQVPPRAPAAGSSLAPVAGSARAVGSGSAAGSARAVGSGPAAGLAPAAGSAPAAGLVPAAGSGPSSSFGPSRRIRPQQQVQPPAPAPGLGLGPEDGGLSGAHPLGNVDSLWTWSVGDPVGNGMQPGRQQSLAVWPQLSWHVGPLLTWQRGIQRPVLVASRQRSGLVDRDLEAASGMPEAPLSSQAESLDAPLDGHRRGRGWWRRLGPMDAGQHMAEDAGGGERGSMLPSERLDAGRGFVSFSRSPAASSAGWSA